ncbi:MAG: hypothetical protein SF051_14860 [Elusimicrobiota bacterium]|nr:hypothetical protein [Elusimicrobiota bacterium]
MAPVFLVLVAAHAFAVEFAPTRAFDDLRAVIAQAGAAGRFPSCAPEPGSVWCRTSTDAFRRTLAPAEDAKLTAALKSLLVGDVLKEFESRVGGDRASLDALAALAARINDPATDLWRLTANPNGLTMVDYSGDKRGLTVPLSLSALLPAGAEAELRRRHNGLVCEPELIVWFHADGRFAHPNTYLGACHDGDE